MGTVDRQDSMIAQQEKKESKFINWDQLLDIERPSGGGGLIGIGGIGI